MYKQTQCSFSGGVLDRDLMGRTDLAKYYSGASKIENLLVRRQGDLAKRRGTDFTADLTNLLGRNIDDASGRALPVGETRLVPLVYERERGYYALLTGRRAFLVGRDGVYCTDGEWRREIPQHYNPAAETGVCDTEDAECFLEDIPYRTLKYGLMACPKGRTVRLAKNVAISGTLRTRGMLDLNGHKLTVEHRATRIIFTGGGSVGVVDSTHGTTANIEWDLPSGQSANYSVAFIEAANCANLRIEGINATYPMTGSSACFAKVGASVGSASMVQCRLSASCDHGLVQLMGNDPDEDAALEIVECELETLDDSYPMIYNGESGSTNIRMAYMRSGRLDCDGPLTNKGVVVKGGIVVCTELASSGPASVVAGLLSYQATSGQIAAGSKYKGTTPDPERFSGTLYNYNLESQGEYEYTRTEIPSTPPATLVRIAPRSIPVPYEDGDLATLDTFQSGDTVFIAHKSYPPAKLLFVPGTLRLSFERIEFNATGWRRPRITAVESSVNRGSSELASGNPSYKTDVAYSLGETSCTKTVTVSSMSSTASEWTVKATTTSTLPLRTVQYAVTYVKDGVESAPSNPVTVTYGAPWEEGGVVKLTFDKGGNAEEPDYYNIYKKDYSGFGLIGSSVEPVTSDVSPEVADADLETGLVSDPAPSPTGAFNGVPLADTDRGDIMTAARKSIVTDVASRVAGSLGEYAVWRGVGGFTFDGKAKFTFPSESAASINRVKVWFDIHELAYVERQGGGKVAVFHRFAGTGKTVRATMWWKDRTGDGSESSAYVEQTLPEISYVPVDDDGDPLSDRTSTYAGEGMEFCGDFEPGASYETLLAGLDRKPRGATFTFDGVTASKQVVRLELTCKDEDGTDVPVRICGMELLSVPATSNDFSDDYITPDMSLTPPTGDVMFAARGEYPSCVGIHQQRLVFAATRGKPGTFWMSATGDLYTFSPHATLREDDPLEATIGATEFPTINHIVTAHDLMLFGDGAEWRVAPITGNALTYKTISITPQSAIGCAKWLKPLVVGSEVLFAERTGATVRAISYDYVQDGYQSQDLTVLAGDIFAGNRIERMCYKQHPDSTVVCVLADGTIATLVYMREHEVVAWSHHTLGGGWLATDVATCKALDGATTDVALVARKSGSVELWTVRPDSPDPAVSAQACLDGARAMTGQEAQAQGAWREGWVAVDLATGALLRSAAALDAEARYLAGYPIRSELVTVRPEPGPQDTIQFEIKNAKSVELRTVSGGEISVAPFSELRELQAVPRRTGTAVADGALAERTDDTSVVLFGANGGDGRVKLVQEDVWPMRLLRLAINYEVQPLSNSEG